MAANHHGRDGKPTVADEELACNGMLARRGSAGMTAWKGNPLTVEGDAEQHVSCG
jgi:hypothetical protein